MLQSSNVEENRMVGITNQSINFYQKLKLLSDDLEKTHNKNLQAQIISLLFERFSLISLNDGFGADFKAPVDKDWTQYCVTKNPNFPSSKNRCGICTGPASNLLVVDVDYTDKFLKFLEIHGISKRMLTLTIESGKGWHLYFQYPSDGRDYRNKAFKEDGFDIRGNLGQVLAPGSCYSSPDKFYLVRNALEIVPAPQWVLNLYNPIEISTEQKTVNSEIALPADLAVMVANLPPRIKELIINGKPKGERSQASWTVLLSLLSNGFSENQINEIYSKYPIGEKSREQAKYHWLEGEIKRAREYLSTNPTKDQASNSTEKTNNGYFCINANELLSSSSKQEYLIDSFLPQHGQVIIHGKAGTFKTHLGLQIAISLANPNETLFLDTFSINNELRPKNILILNGENSHSELNQKISMIEYNINESDKTEINSKIHFMGYNECITFGDTFDNKKFVDSIDKLIKENTIDLLIIDNLQCYNGNDENDNTKMRQLVDNVTAIKSANNISVILIHHSGKGDAKELRGASSIKDWASVIVVIEEIKDGYELHNTKNRSARKFDSIKLKFDDHILVRANIINNIKNHDIITQIMRQQPNKTVDSQDKLTKLIQDYHSKNNIVSSIQSIKKMIEDAVTSGKLNKTKGNANSNIYTLIE